MAISRLVTIAALGLSVLGGGPAFSQSALSSTSTIVNSPTGCTSTAASQCPESYGFAVSTGTINAVTANPTTYTFGDTFNQVGSTSTLSDFGTSVYTQASSAKCATPGTAGNCVNSSPFLTWNFQDNYQFTTPVAGSQVQGAVVSFALPNGIGLGSLEARIVGTNVTAAADLVGTSPVTVVDGWMQTTQTVVGSMTLYQAVLNTTPLAANTSYFLQIRGEAGAAASYAGTVTFTPVPLPGTVALLLSGLMGLVFARRAPILS